MAGSLPGSNSTSTTGPMICTILPTFAITHSLVASLPAAAGCARLSALGCPLSALHEAPPDAFDLPQVVRVVMRQVHEHLAGAELAEGRVGRRPVPRLASHDLEQRQVPPPEDPELLQGQPEILPPILMPGRPAILVPGGQPHLVLGQHLAIAPGIRHFGVGQVAHQLVNGPLARGRPVEQLAPGKTPGETRESSRRRGPGLEGIRDRGPVLPAQGTIRCSHRTPNPHYSRSVNNAPSGLRLRPAPTLA